MTSYDFIVRHKQDIIVGNSFMKIGQRDIIWHHVTSFQDFCHKSVQKTADINTKMTADLFEYSAPL